MTLEPDSMFVCRLHIPSRWICGFIALAAALAPFSCSPPDNVDNNVNRNDNGLDVQYQVSPDGRAVAAIDPQGFLEVLRLSRTEPAVVLRPLIEAYILDYAAKFPSGADFLIFTLDAHREQLDFNAVGGFNITVRAPEAGLGVFVSIPILPQMDNLRSFIYLARKDSLVLGPSLHELAHAWGVRFDAPPVLGAQADDSESHWGYSGVGGQMGGWVPDTLVDLGPTNDGHRNYQLSFGNVEPNGRSFNTLPYAPLELYIMGMLDPREVDAIEVAVNPSFVSLFEFTADDIELLDIEDIVAANGVRIPSFENAQRNFTIAFVTLTDHLLSNEEWEFYGDSMDYFSKDEVADIFDAFPAERYADEPIFDLIGTPDLEDPSRHFMNFFEATGGIATVEFLPVGPSNN